MLPTLTIIDDLLGADEALHIRDKVLSQGFQDLPYMGGLYQGTNVQYQSTHIKKAVETFFNAMIDIKISAFRSGHKDTHLHVNIHADNPIARWAWVYYLNLPKDCRGGTAFYRMKQTDWDTMPTQEVMDSAGMTLEEVKQKWVEPDAWDMISLAGMKFDRMIIYPTEFFHSRFPLAGWGEPTELEKARLVNVGFFNILPT